MGRPLYPCLSDGIARPCHAYVMQVTLDSTDIEERCIHCGHTQPIERNDNMNKFKEYPYLPVRRKENALKIEYHADPGGAWCDRESAIRQADKYKESNPDEVWGVAKMVYESELKETIQDLDGKNYTIERSYTTTTVIAPCGEKQTFANDTLKKLAEGK